MKNSINDEHIEMGQLLQRLDDFSARIQYLEHQLKITQKGKPNVPQNDNLANRFADQISVIGLKEALTFKHRSIKVAWVILLILGSTATTYYIVKNTMEYLEREKATRVTLVSNSSYEYPPLVLCPPWWFNFRNATQGLSEDALKYSLYYSNQLDEYVDPDIQNLTIAGTEFRNFYKKQNFTSLINYYGRISAKWTRVNWSDEADWLSELKLASENSTLSWSCGGCAVGLVRSKIFSNAVCYIFKLKDARANATTDLRLVSRDKTKGILERVDGNNFWFFDFLPNIRAGGPSLKLKSFFSHTLKLSIQNITKLDSCEISPNYNQRESIENCLNVQSSIENNGLCGGLLTETSQPSNTTNWAELDLVPSDLLPQNEILTNTNTTNNKTKDKTTNKLLDEQLQNCYDKFQPPCIRQIYDITAEEEKMNEDEMNNTSIIEININHAATFQGGIVNWQEMEKITTSDFVANIGGTLGVFLGCSVLTLAQLILSLVNYMVDNSLKNSVIASQSLNPA